tara:strand:- start:1254 stop:1451 length:198 start_codon:yes stop_codon:yes gene_type:complete
MKVGDLVKHGWTKGKHGLITKITDRRHRYSPGEDIRIYDILWVCKGYSYVSEEASFAFEVISENR